MVKSLKPDKERLAEYGNNVGNGTSDQSSRPSSRCVTYCQLLNLSVPHLLFLLKNVKKTHLRRLRGLRETIHLHLVQSLAGVGVGRTS